MMWTDIALYFAVTVLVLTVASLLWRSALAYFKIRGVRLVRCPETATPAGVEINARHAALGLAIGLPNVQVKSCSRWPERQGCEQKCLAQIEASPEDCLVRTILTRWYYGKSCVFCGKPVGEMEWLEHKPALMSPAHITLEWKDIRAETLPDVLDTHTPVCWNCHVAETFRRCYPNLVVYRPWRAGTEGRSR